MSEDEPVILGPEHMHLLYGVMDYLRQIYLSAGIMRNGDPVLTIDYIDMHFPHIPMTLRIPIVLDGSPIEQMLGLALPPRKTRKVDKLGLLSPPKLGQP